MAKRKAWIDWVNAFAALSVVFLHCNCFWDGPLQGRSWLSANFIEAFFYPAVPLFFMNTGATLLNYRERMNTKTYLKRRFAKTLIPFLVWSLIGMLFAQLCLRATVDWSPLAVIDSIINARYMNIYWFFPTLFGCYLAIPVLSTIRPRKEGLLYILLCGFVFVAVLPLFCALAGIHWKASFTPPVAGGFTLYLAAGWIIDNESVHLSKMQVGIIYSLGVAGFLLQLIGTHVLSTEAGEIVLTYKEYTNMPCVLQSVATYLFAKRMCTSLMKRGGIWHRLDNHIHKISQLTFGVYLCHRYFIAILTGALDIPTTSIIWRTAGAVGVFCISLGFTWALQRVPVVRRIVP